MNTNELLHEGILNELGFKATQDETCYISEFKTLYVGVEAFEHDLFRSAAATAIKMLSKFNYTSLKLAQHDVNDAEGIFSALIEGFILGAYNFDTYKSEKKNSTLSKIIFSNRTLEDEASDIAVLDERLVYSQIVAAATNYTRELVNTTPEDLFPAKLANIAKDLASQKNVIRCDLDTISAQLDENRAHRKAAIRIVKKILAQEQASFIEWLAQEPMRELLAERMLYIRDELAHRHPDMSQDELRQVSNRLVRKLLKDPETLADPEKSESLLNQVIVHEKSEHLWASAPTS